MALGTMGPGRAPKGKYVGGYGGTSGGNGGGGGNTKTQGGGSYNLSTVVGRKPLPSGMMKGCGPAK
jgi:hypothetical protein